MFMKNMFMFMTYVYEKQVFMFHFHFMVRRILYEIGAPLPGDQRYNPKNNYHNKVAIDRLRAEFGAKEDFRYTYGLNNGLRYVWAYWRIGGHELTPKEVYTLRYHTVSYDDSTFFEPNFKITKKVRDGPLFKDEGGVYAGANPLIKYIKNENTRPYLNFIPKESKGLTKAGLARINRSIEALVYCILGAQVNTRSSIVGNKWVCGRNSPAIPSPI